MSHWCLMGNLYQLSFKRRMIDQRIERRIKSWLYCINQKEIKLVYIIYSANFTAKLYLRSNNKAARACLLQSLDITPAMAAAVIRACRQFKPAVKIVVAPFEADAQLGIPR